MTAEQTRPFDLLQEASWIQRDCPLCSSQTNSSLFAESSVRLEALDSFAFASRKLPEYTHARLLECAGCDLVYASPSLDPSLLANCYRDANFDSGLESAFAAKTYARVLRSLIPTLPEPLTALDIGCGDGAFLNYLQAAGFSDVAGVEPSMAPIRAANPEISGRIRHGLFSQDDYAPSSFSLISCFQVMEHVSNPLELCAGAFALLKPGGVFAIIAHNRRALSARILGRKSPIFDIEHLQLFSRRSGRRLLESAGFANVSVSGIWNRYPMQYWLKLFPLPTDSKLRLMKLSRKFAIGNLPFSMPAGNLLFIGGRP